MIFTPQVSFDTVLSVISLLGGLFAIYQKLRSSIVALLAGVQTFTVRINELEEEVKKLGQITELMANQTSRLNSLEEKLNAIKIPQNCPYKIAADEIVVKPKKRKLAAV